MATTSEGPSMTTGEAVNPAELTSNPTMATDTHPIGAGGAELAQGGHTGSGLTNGEVQQPKGSDQQSAGVGVDGEQRPSAFGSSAAAGMSFFPPLPFLPHYTATAAAGEYSNGAAAGLPSFYPPPPLQPLTLPLPNGDATSSQTGAALSSSSGAAKRTAAASRVKVAGVGAMGGVGGVSEKDRRRLQMAIQNEDTYAQILARVLLRQLKEKMPGGNPQQLRISLKGKPDRFVVKSDDRPAAAFAIHTGVTNALQQAIDERNTRAAALELPPWDNYQSILAVSADENERKSEGEEGVGDPLAGDMSLCHGLEEISGTANGEGAGDAIYPFLLPVGSNTGAGEAAGGGQGGRNGSLYVSETETAAIRTMIQEISGRLSSLLPPSPSSSPRLVMKLLWESETQSLIAQYGFKGVTAAGQPFRLTRAAEVPRVMRQIITTRNQLAQRLGQPLIEGFDGILDQFTLAMSAPSVTHPLTHHTTGGSGGGTRGRRGSKGGGGLSRGHRQFPAGAVCGYPSEGGGLFESLMDFHADMPLKVEQIHMVAATLLKQLEKHYVAVQRRRGDAGAMFPFGITWDPVRCRVRWKVGHGHSRKHCEKRVSRNGGGDGLREAIQYAIDNRNAWARTEGLPEVTGYEDILQTDNATLLLSADHRDFDSHLLTHQQAHTSHSVGRDRPADLLARIKQDTDQDFMLMNTADGSSYGAAAAAAGYGDTDLMQMHHTPTGHGQGGGRKRKNSGAGSDADKPGGKKAKRTTKKQQQQQQMAAEAFEAPTHNDQQQQEQQQQQVIDNMPDVAMKQPEEEAAPADIDPVAVDVSAAAAAAAGGEQEAA
ncbi:unnamed protein product [Vitrella brassicaformis CCMP3155]|uniref:Uncharacterized protein n=2 Tax=Vitrella brassicaformis TaxID=1169539 RepID=A0A0G4EXP8_VITBC|nr:unnamed protein product [Vitrella brassicaformis CCMP3155]|eukprot:CEM03598.1 unnamed protein product [Vitrella brassicaformis CCMP3155]